MNNIARLPTNDFSARDLALVRRTVAADTTDDEFNIFVNYCSTLGLNPLRRQVYALVYNKADAKKRKMSIIVAIDGFRAVAARTGNYRPDDEEPRFEFDAEAKSPTNPLGFVKAVVKVWQFSHGEWFPVTASAYWDEYAPTRDEWAEGEDGKRRPTGKKTLDGKWPTMGRLMLAKCAEALALRKAWPDDFSNVYAPEELDRAQADMTAAELAAAGAVTERLERIGGGGAIVVDWLNGAPIEPVAAGKFADRVLEFLEQNRDAPSQIGLFEARNRHALREFWAQSPGDALELKKKIEQFQAEAMARGDE